MWDISVCYYYYISFLGPYTCFDNTYLINGQSLKIYNFGRSIYALVYHLFGCRAA